MRSRFIKYNYLQLLKIALRIKKTFYFIIFKIKKSLFFYELSLRMTAPFSWRKKLALLEIEEKYEKVVELCQNKIKRNETYPPVLFEILARNYRNLNQADKALSYIIMAKEVNYCEPSIYYEEGLIYFLKKNYGKARHALERVLNDGYDTPPLQIHLGKIYYQLGLMDKAEKCFQKVLMMYPHEGSIYFLLGIVLKNKMCYTEAKQAFKKAIEYGSNNKEEHLALAEIYTREGYWNKAIEEYKYILLIDPDSFVAHYFLGLIYEIMGNDSQAIQEFILANKINPNDNDTRIRLVKLLESTPS